MISKHWLLAAALGLGALAGVPDNGVAAPFMPAATERTDTAVLDVRYRGGGGGGGYRGGYRGHSYGHVHRHYRARPYFYVAPPVALYGYGTYRGSHCSWLHRRARETGSPYWWRRYRDEC